MIAALLRGILLVIDFIFDWFVTPLFNGIETIYDSLKLSQFIGLISQFFTTITSYVNFVASYTGLYTTTIYIICFLLIGIITIPIVVSGYKIVVRWIDVLT